MCCDIGFTMQHFRNLFSRHCYRHFPFWILFFVLLYTALGFLAVPKLLHKTITEQVQQNLGWHTAIQKIEFNPYKLTLNIESFSITNTDDKEVIGFDRFFTNFTLRSLFELAVTFDNIELTQPRFNLIINKDGSTNISEALDAHVVESIEEENDEAPSNGIIPLLFDNLSVTSGALHLTDKQPNTAVEHIINPISFNLQHFSTRLNEDGNYQLDIALGTGQNLNWKGVVALNPVSSSGVLNISDIKLHNFWPYLQTFLPYELTHGLASVTGEYQMSLLDDQLALNVENAQVGIEKLQFASKALDNELIDIKKIDIGPIDFNLEDKSLTIDDVIVDEALFNLLRDQKGQLTMLTELSEHQKVTTESEAQVTEKNQSSKVEVHHRDKESANVNTVSIDKEAEEELEIESEQPFSWAINRMAMINSQVNWLDKQPTPDAEIAIKEINIELNSLNQDLSSILPFHLNYLVDSSEKNDVKGELTITPFSLNSHLSLAGINLTAIQPYLNEFARVKLNKGLLFTDADLQLSENRKGEIVGDFAGAINIKEFNSRDKILNKRLAGWQELSINPIKISLNPLTVDIDKIAFTKPYFRMIITEDFSTNLSKLMIENESSKTSTKQQKNASNEESLAIRVGEITLKDGSAYFADLSLQPQFGSSIENMNGKVSGLISTSDKAAKVDIKGTIEDYGKMSIKGELKPFAEDLYTDIDANFDKVELTTLTPYSGRYAGYVIDKGKLSLHLNYKINKGKLNGQNKLILDQLELGKKVESKDAVDLPLKLALALFKDKDGVIDIDLPTSGNLDDPEFKISGVLLKALGNLITKAVSSPFSAMASLVDDDPEKLNSIAFELGSSELNEEQKSNLKVLADGLISRPQLILEVRVQVDQKADGEVLKAQKLTRRLLRDGVDIDDSEELLDAMETHYENSKPVKSLDEIKQAARIEAFPNDDINRSLSDHELDIVNEHYISILHSMLVEAEPLGSLEVLNLAKQRVTVIKQQLITINKVPNAQVYALNPSLSGVAEQQKIVTHFELGAQ